MGMNYRGGLWEGGGGQDGVELGGEWDNCNSIINKYIKNNNNKKEKNIAAFFLGYKNIHLLFNYKDKLG